MRVNVYGRLDGKCGLCESAKEKLTLMGIRFTALELSDYTTLHDGWRDDESVEVLACYNDIETYPVITLDGKAMSYPAAMKVLKALQPSRPAAPKPEKVRVEERELVLA